MSKHKDQNKSIGQYKFIDQISCLENLMLAWRKLEHSFNHGDVWFDGLVISAFKMNLVDNLTKISTQLKEGTYQMNKIQPIPFPKGGKDADGHLKVRQSFFIDFRDQLVWVAVCNVIGRNFDIKMPAWSYGNRQYISMWKEINDNGQFWKIGNHRNTSRHIYRTWAQSWPLMRKRITASLKKMAGLKDEDIDDADIQVENEEEQLEPKQEFFKLHYLEKNYFPESKPFDILYWSGIDLKQFYQKVNMDKLRQIIVSTLGGEPQGGEQFIELINKITHFEIDYSDYQYKDADKDLADMQLDKKVAFDGLPTGLLVAGLLANIYMLEIDKAVSDRLENEKDIIHFRYVDDHVIISTSAEKLFEWISWYQELLTNKGLVLNVSKLAPENITKGLVTEESNQESLDNLKIANHRELFISNIQTYACINPKYPTPLMTQTLQKVSMLQGLNLNLLSTREFAMVFGELQSLLVADLPEQEIKESTRISFACTMLTRLLVDGEMDYEKIHHSRLMWLEEIEHIKKSFIKKLEKKAVQNEIDTEDKINQLVETYTDIIFHDLELIPIDELKNTYPNINFKYLEKINDEIEKGRETTKRKERLVFNMLMYALDKVPDKVRVWVRAFDYCLHHEPKEVRHLYKKLADYDEKGLLHKLSVDFLTALLNTLCAENIVKATARLVLNNYSSPLEAEKDKQFIESLKAIANQESTHFFVKDSQYILSKAFGFFNLYAKKIQINPYNEVEEFFSDNPNYHGNKLDSTFWLLWVVDLLKDRKQKYKPIFSSLLYDHLLEAKPESDYFKAFFFTYLREISVTSTKKMKLPDHLCSTEKWLDNSTKYTISQMNDVAGLNKLLTKEDKKYLKATSKKEYKNLAQWIDYANSIEKSNDKYELTHSELMSVLIMLSVIQTIHARGEEKDDLHLHLENFYLPTNSIKKTWPYYISMIDEEHFLHIKYIFNENISNNQYSYPKFLNEQTPINSALSYGLGIMFLQLLSKKKVLPWALNSEQVGFEWQYVLHQLQGQGRLSSLNYRIVNACLSPRQRENLQLSLLLGDEYVREPFQDNPKIQNWKDLERELKKSLVDLRRNLVSVANEAHRQLTVIDLD